MLKRNHYQLTEETDRIWKYDIFRKAKIVSSSMRKNYINWLISRVTLLSIQRKSKQLNRATSSRLVSSNPASDKMADLYGQRLLEMVKTLLKLHPTEPSPRQKAGKWFTRTPQTKPTTRDLTLKRSIWKTRSFTIESETETKQELTEGVDLRF